MFSGMGRWPDVVNGFCLCFRSNQTELFPQGLALRAGFQANSLVGTIRLQPNHAGSASALAVTADGQYTHLGILSTSRTRADSFCTARQLQRLSHTTSEPVFHLFDWRTGTGALGSCGDARIRTWNACMLNAVGQRPEIASGTV